MLPQADILQTIAEVAVAVAGFAALAGAFSSGRLDAQDVVSGFQSLRLVVLSGLFVLTAALIPLVISEYGLTASTTWRLSSGIVYGINLIALVRNRNAIDSGFQENGWFALPITMILEAACHAVLLANIFGVFGEFASALYLTFLVSRFAQMAMMFLRFFEIAFMRGSTELMQPPREKRKPTRPE